MRGGTFVAEWDPIVPWKCSMQLECVFGCLSLMKCNATFPADLPRSTRGCAPGSSQLERSQKLAIIQSQIFGECQIPSSRWMKNGAMERTAYISSNQFWYIYVINGFVQNWTNYIYQTLFGKWLKDVEGSRQHLLRCTAAHFKNMRMVFDTTFCGDFPASSGQLFKHAMKIYEKYEHVANFWKHGLSFPDSGDYAGASFNTYCGWTHMQCEAYVRSKPNDFRRWDCSSWVESNWYVMRSSWAEGWNINLWKVATQSDNQFRWFDMIFHAML